MAKPATPNTPAPIREISALEIVKPVYRAISARAAQFSPSIKLIDHIARDLVVKPSIGDGITFKPVSVDGLRSALLAARTFDGLRAFTDIKGLDAHHFPLFASMAATQGEGFREIRPLPMLPGRGFETLDMSSAREAFNRQDGWNAAFSAGFGQSLSLTLHSLHWALSEESCSVHVDKFGFTARLLDGTLALTPDAIQHIFLELLLQDKFKQMLPRKYHGYIDRITLSYPNSDNRYQWTGPSVGQLASGLADLPVLGLIGHLPGAHSVGSVLKGVGNARLDLPTPLSWLAPDGVRLKNLPLPSVAYDVMRGSQYRVQLSLSMPSGLGFTATVGTQGVF